MKTLTITLHDNENYGSSLQAFALQKFLLQNNIDNQIIDYVPAYIKNNGRPVRTFFRKTLMHNESKQKEEKFSHFKDKYLRISSKKYSSFEELVKSPPIGDIYITGSDQLWNSNYPCGRDRAFYLQFVHNGKKMAYAVSLGRDFIPENEAHWIKNNTETFNWISFREGSSLRIFQDFVHCPINHVCDPTLLLDLDIYRSIQVPVEYSCPYVLVYLVDPSPLLEETLQYLRKKFGYKIILFGSYRNKCTCDWHLVNVGPEEFLGWINGAALVLSSSFHATIFSHIYKKNFAVILPKKNQARIIEFLNLSGLQRCIVSSENDFGKVFEPIEYSDSDCLLKSFVKQSKEKLLLNCWQ